jgi:AraC-like DNA-binding protein
MNTGLDIIEGAARDQAVPDVEQTALSGGCSSGGTMKDAARAAGFPSREACTRAFTTQLGLSPRAWLRGG